MNRTSPITYKDAGVDIDAGNALVDRIKHVAKRTRRPEVMGSLGGFGALCEIPSGYRQPVLVSGTDGVGTKLKLAMDLGLHKTIGIDLVAMCVNDLVVAGAEPLFFLDYYATGKLDVDMAADVVSGIGLGCEMAGCALVGGETAEMPGMYEGSDYDLAGFCVGVVEKDQIIDGSNVHAGQKLVALPSSGVHSNGYSLVRKIIETQAIDPSTCMLGKKTVGQLLMEPTRIYAKTLLALQKSFTVSAMAHITGGGLLENIPRVLPANTCAVLDTQSWEMPPIFHWLQEGAQLSQEAMFRTFNCGVGMVIAVDEQDAQNVVDYLQSMSEDAWIIGAIEHSSDSTPSVSCS